LFDLLGKVTHQFSRIRAGTISEAGKHIRQAKALRRRVDHRPAQRRQSRSATAFNHYSLLRTTEELLWISTYLGNAATATSMRSAFGL
jgi:hypothetical protein